MTARDILNNASRFLRSNSPTILTATSVTGVLTTSYFVAKGTVQAIRKIDLADDKKTAEEWPDTTRGLMVDRFKIAWSCYIPAAISGFVTISSIVGTSHIQSRRTASAITAFTLGETAFAEYREKIAEQIGDSKERKVRDEIAQDKVRETPPKETIIFNDGDVLCCDLLTMRYFKSSMEKLRRAENEINSMILRDKYVTVDDFYDLIGVWHTESSDRLGWDGGRLMELEFTTVLTPDNQPCIAFRFNYVRPL